VRQAKQLRLERGVEIRHALVVGHQRLEVEPEPSARVRRRTVSSPVERLTATFTRMTTGSTVHTRMRILRAVNAVRAAGAARAG
jgi:hypothetical protein